MKRVRLAGDNIATIGRFDREIEVTAFGRCTRQHAGQGKRKPVWQRTTRDVDRLVRHIAPDHDGAVDVGRTQFPIL